MIFIVVRFHHHTYDPSQYGNLMMIMGAELVDSGGESKILEMEAKPCIENASVL